MRHARILAAACVAAFATFGAPAEAQQRNRLLGNWCGQPGNPNLTNYRFTAEQLRVTYPDDGTRKAFRITRYEFPAPGEIAVVYRAGDSDEKGGAPGDAREFRALYHRFSADGREMWQAAGVSPAYRFRRC